MANLSSEKVTTRKESYGSTVAASSVHASQAYPFTVPSPATSRGARDGTKYGLSRLSPRSYLAHHIQRIAFAAVRANAKHARWMISCYKMGVCSAA